MTAPGAAPAARRGATRPRVAWVLALALLATTGALGLRNGWGELPGAATALQRVVTGGVLAYGVLGPTTLAGSVARRRWAPAAAAAWGAVVTGVATLAPIAYGGPDVPLAGALAGGAVTALIALGVWWAVRHRARTAAR
jgi:hypothetical protein